MLYENEKQLEQSLTEWQKTLRLQDWDIKASIVRGSAMTLKDKQGAVRWSFASKSATIELLDPTDYSYDFEEQDHEVTLVHELLHLHYAGFDGTESGSLADSLVEQSIEAISRALVVLKRAAERKDVSSNGTATGESNIRTTI